MSVLQINARSLVKYEKRFLLSNAISLCQPAVVCICETWLNNKISDSELLLNDYLFFRSDRKSTKDKNPHGGTLIAIQSALNCRRLILDDVDSCVVCEIPANKSKIFFCSFYNPPKTSPCRYSIKDFEKILSCVSKNCIAFVCGDFNFPNTNWTNGTSTDSEENSVLELSENRLFRQSIDFPTCSKNLLDVVLHQNCNVFSTNADAFTKVFNCFDHIGISSTIELPHVVQNSTRDLYWKIASEMEQTTFLPTCFTNIDNFYEELEEYLANLIRRNVPSRTRHRQPLPPWIKPSTSHLLRKLKTKKRGWF